MRCQRCETPHHRDCFEYAGCATYGCGGRQATADEGAAPTGEPTVTYINGDEKLRACPRCRRPVEAPAVACFRCGTLHHRPCFDGSGCAERGCGDRRGVPIDLVRAGSDPVLPRQPQLMMGCLLTLFAFLVFLAFLALGGGVSKPKRRSSGTTWKSTGTTGSHGKRVASGQPSQASERRKKRRLTTRWEDVRLTFVDMSPLVYTTSYNLLPPPPGCGYWELPLPAGRYDRAWLALEPSQVSTNGYPVTVNVSTAQTSGVDRGSGGLEPTWTPHLPIRLVGTCHHLYPIRLPAGFDRIRLKTPEPHRSFQLRGIWAHKDDGAGGATSDCSRELTVKEVAADTLVVGDRSRSIRLPLRLLSRLPPWTASLTSPGGGFVVTDWLGTARVSRFGPDGNPQFDSLQSSGGVGLRLYLDSDHEPVERDWLQGSGVAGLLDAHRDAEAVVFVHDVKTGFDYSLFDDGTVSVMRRAGPAGLGRTLYPDLERLLATGSSAPSQQTADILRRSRSARPVRPGDRVALGWMPWYPMEIQAPETLWVTMLTAGGVLATAAAGENRGAVEIEIPRELLPPAPAPRVRERLVLIRVPGRSRDSRDPLLTATRPPTRPSVARAAGEASSSAGATGRPGLARVWQRFTAEGRISGQLLGNSVVTADRPVEIALGVQPHAQLLLHLVSGSIAVDGKPIAVQAETAYWPGPESFSLPTGWTTTTVIRLGCLSDGSDSPWFRVAPGGPFNRVRLSVDRPGVQIRARRFVATERPSVDTPLACTRTVTVTGLVDDTVRLVTPDGSTATLPSRLVSVDPPPWEVALSSPGARVFVALEALSGNPLIVGPGHRRLGSLDLMDLMGQSYRLPGDLVCGPGFKGWLAGPGGLALLTSWSREQEIDFVHHRDLDVALHLFRSGSCGLRFYAGPSRAETTRLLFVDLAELEAWQRHFERHTGADGPGGCDWRCSPFTVRSDHLKLARGGRSEKALALFLKEALERFKARVPAARPLAAGDRLLVFWVCHGLTTAARSETALVVEKIDGARVTAMSPRLGLRVELPYGFLPPAPEPGVFKALAIHRLSPR
ncbi:MAG: hypothetical protein HY815_12070 [Candidatus Riflebacteria bacterium]|nr:hypothetical protein [Candidatus Riflebacteria bacterium]